jgi:hypothetical protein
MIARYIMRAPAVGIQSVRLGERDGSRGSWNRRHIRLQMKE